MDESRRPARFFCLRRKLSPWMSRTWLWCMRSSTAEAIMSSPKTWPHCVLVWVGGEEQAAALVASADELEEQVCGLLLEEQVAELVDAPGGPARALRLEISTLTSFLG